MYQIYQIMPNDSLESVANKFNITLENLAEINGVSPFETLIPGNYLVVPKIFNGMYSKYIVKKGDNLYAIAKRFNTTTSVLESINGLKANEYIYPNQELLVPNMGESIYVTKEETLQDIVNKSGKSLEEIVSKNNQIYVMPDQIIVY